MRVRSVLLLASLVIALPGAVRADDIVYFTNGTAMPVRSHKIEKGMIRVDLGSNASMAFPVTMVEKVESSGRNVFPGGAVPANQAVAAPNTTVTGAASVPAQFRQMRRDDPEQQLARAQAREKNDGSLYTSPPGANTAAKRNLRVISGGTPVLNEDGSYRRGNVSVFPAPSAPVSRGDEAKPVITSFGPPTGKSEPVAEENSGDGDDGGGGEPEADDPPDQR